VKGDQAVLALGELEASAVDRVDVLREHGGGIGRMASVGAVLGEATDRVLQGKLEQGTLVKAPPGAFHGTLGPGHQGEVAEADPSRLEGGDTRRKVRRGLAGRHRACRHVAGHPALMPDPVDR